MPATGSWLLAPDCYPQARGATALFLAAQNGHLAAVKALLAARADTEAATEVGAPTLADRSVAALPACHPRLCSCTLAPMRGRGKEAARCGQPEAHMDMHAGWVQAGCEMCWAWGVEGPLP